ncbi:dodecin family protein [Kangiella aquimarina]|uniref:Dodecin family protein n=1 Tax=Kangiella aquimarina TaxID=261965 RepID=A0ABZ0X4U0_9GAMM|nr:dodecin family protein [Kangiella aquimarina]WQG85626.1 dodecin family protein [Kangiella aquimarina]
MSVAKVTEIIADSAESFEDAVRKGIRRANKTLDQVKAAWVKEQQVVIKDGEVESFRVVMKVTFLLKD